MRIDLWQRMLKEIVKMECNCILRPISVHYDFDTGGTSDRVFVSFSETKEAAQEVYDYVIWVPQTTDQERERTMVGYHSDGMAVCVSKSIGTMIGMLTMHYRMTRG